MAMVTSKPSPGLDVLSAQSAQGAWELLKELKPLELKPMSLTHTWIF